jgi:hypothetical protein
MTFLQIRQRIAELMGVSSVDTTPDANATMENKLKAWVNDRYKVLAGKESWNWLIGDIIIQTVEDITTGTVTATTASTTITFSSGPTDSVAGYFIQFSDTDDWYEISAHTAAATTATLTTAFLGTTSSTLTYILRKVYYTLPSTTGKILNVRQMRTKSTLTYIPIRHLDLVVPDRTRVATPTNYTISGVTSDRLYKMEFYPVPNEAMNINVRHYKIITEMTADTDVPIIPEAYHGILVWDVLSTYGFTFLDDTRLSSAKAEFNNLFKDMKKNHVDVENIAVRNAFDVEPSQATSQLAQQNLPITQ